VLLKNSFIAPQDNTIVELQNLPRKEKRELLPRSHPRQLMSLVSVWFCSLSRQFGIGETRAYRSRHRKSETVFNGENREGFELQLHRRKKCAALRPRIAMRLPELSSTRQQWTG
jgi:hypothetical protein